MNTDNLERLALAATPGPWTIFDQQASITIIAPDTKFGAISICTVSINTRHDEGRHNRDFIAACDPQTILALLADNERLRAALQELVACKDLRVEVNSALHLYDESSAEYIDIREEYDRRQPLAWSAARAAMSGITAGRIRAALKETAP